MENHLASLLKVIAEHELEIELARISLTESSNFDARHVFNVVAKKAGYIDRNNLKAFLDTYQIAFNLEELDLVIRQYDSNSKGVLNLNDFENAILSKTNPFVKPQSTLGGQQDTEYILADFFAKEIQLNRAAGPLRAELNETSGWTSYDSFKSIDTTNRGSFNYQDLDNFMINRNSYYLSNADILSIFRRANKSGNGRITYPEFKENILSELVSKSYYNDYRLNSSTKTLISPSNPTYVTKIAEAPTPVITRTYQYVINEKPYLPNLRHQLETPYYPGKYTEVYDYPLTKYSTYLTPSKPIQDSLKLSSYVPSYDNYMYASSSRAYNYPQLYDYSYSSYKYNNLKSPYTYGSPSRLTQSLYNNTPYRYNTNPYGYISKYDNLNEYSSSRLSSSPYSHRYHNSYNLTSSYYPKSLSSYDLKTSLSNYSQYAYPRISDYSNYNTRINPYSYSQSYYSKYTPIRSSYYNDFDRNSALKSYKTYYDCYVTSPSSRPYYSPSQYTSELTKSSYVIPKSPLAYRKRYYDDEHIPYYSYKSYVPEVRADITPITPKRYYVDDNLFMYDTSSKRRLYNSDLITPTKTRLRASRLYDAKDLRDRYSRLSDNLSYDLKKY